MKPIIKKLSKQNIKEVRIELARAHLIIALLAFVTIILFTVGSACYYPADVNYLLSSIASLLMMLVVVISTITAYALLTIANKK
jgi:hypothetical protein